MDKPVIVWFRQDLRLADNPALSAAAQSGRPIVPVYVLDEAAPPEQAMGSASRWWLHHSLASLDRSLGGDLTLLRGDAATLIPELCETIGADKIYWNRCYEPWRTRSDATIRSVLENLDIRVHAFDGSVLFPPQSVTKPDGSPYRVFTPYYRKGCVARSPAPREPLPVPKFSCQHDVGGLTLDALELMPRIRWYDGIAATWSPGEQNAHQQLEEFLGHGLEHYKLGRNRPDKPYVSRLSPHLRFGEISPNQAWYAASSGDENTDHFRSELGWRDFSNYLLFHFPDLPHRNFQRKFDNFPWRDDPELLERWQRGQTGIPIVDAGMRELWHTGYMHNRVRMIVASFLVKNLLIHWRHGADWFWDTLVDADLANNSASWQWVAGSGADAAPYFRIFNPLTQAEKFDPSGDYVRRWVNETDNPEPIVDLKESRERALAAFKVLSHGSRPAADPA